MDNQHIGRIGLFLSLIKGVTMKGLLALKDEISSLPETQVERLLSSYDEMKSLFPTLGLSKDLFLAGIERRNQLEPLLEQEGIGYFTFFDTEYPAKLRQIHQPPKVLYYRGNRDLLKYSPSIAIVGTRKPTPYGIWTTKKLAGDLADNGFCIISGMATGVDGLSHEEAIKREGKTICVLGGSIHRPYPKSHGKLMNKVLDAGGLILSEYSPLDSTVPGNFAFRNRIVSGLSEGVLIVEAGMKSGTLITANYALEQGKTVFAVPGNINSRYSIGTNNLIKDGAVIVSSVYDILEEYQMEYEQHKSSTIPAGMSEIESKIYQDIQKKGICHVEQIAGSIGIDIKDLTGILNIMEIKGLINYDGFMASMNG